MAKENYDKYQRLIDEKMSVHPIDWDGVDYLMYLQSLELWENLGLMEGFKKDSYHMYVDYSFTLFGKDKGDVEDIDIPTSGCKRKSGRAQRRRDSYYAMRRKATRLSRFEPELDERKLRIVGKWAHAECHGWWTEKEAEDYRKALRGAFAKSELHIPEPNISKVKVCIHA